MDVVTIWLEWIRFIHKGLRQLCITKDFYQIRLAQVKMTSRYSLFSYYLALSVIY